MNFNKVFPVLIVLGVIGFAASDEFRQLFGKTSAPDFGGPNWTAIANWPEVPEGVEMLAQPDPSVTVAVLILDDSGSMSSSFADAKGALVQSLDYFSADDQVAVLALNAGLVLPAMPVEQARSELSPALQPLRSDGSTPLTRAVLQARDILSELAAERRGFGTYQIIVTTDGAADQEEALSRVVADTVTNTSIQIATVATKSLPGHALNAAGYTSFTTIAGVAGLAEALAGAIAENSSFVPITAFEGE